MRRCSVTVALLLAGCSSSGSELAPPEAGADASVDATSLPPGEDAAMDAAIDVPCFTVDAGTSGPSVDCVYLGRCPASCTLGTASAYACLPGPEGGAGYPSVFEPPFDPLEIVGVLDAAYPWDAAAYVACAGLACTRWATADVVDDSSVWAPDPCAAASPDAALLPQAWVCPPSPGVLPPVAGCAAAGDLQAIGGGDSGIPAQPVWCCPAPRPARDD